MEQNDIIDKIINNEIAISNFISYLFELELYDDRNSDVFNNFFDLYKLAVDDENKLFSSLNDNQFNYLCDNFNNNKLFKNDFLLEYKFNSFDKRLKNRINEYLNNIACSDIYIENERKDIYLSFLDEYIATTDDFSIKKTLIQEKYNIIFNTNCIHENEIIKRKLYTGNSIILTSEFVSMFEGSNYELYYILKMKSGMKFLNEINKDIIDIKNNDGIDKSKLLILFLKIRTGLLMIDTDSFNNIINRFKNIIGDFEVFNCVFDEDFEESLINDRRRHKTLSFIKK